MLVEAAVLDREDGIDHVRGNGRERHVAALLTAGGDQRSDERRAQRQVGGRGLRSDDLDPLDDGGVRVLHTLSTEHDANLLLLEVAVLRHDHQGIASDRELAAERGFRAVRVSEVVEAVDELVRRQRLTAVQLEGTREHARVDPLHFTVNARIDHPGEQDVVVAHDRRQDDERA